MLNITSLTSAKTTKALILAGLASLSLMAASTALADSYFPEYNDTNVNYQSRIAGFLATRGEGALEDLQELDAQSYQFHIPTSDAFAEKISFKTYTPQDNPRYPSPLGGYIATRGEEALEDLNEDFATYTPSDKSHYPSRLGSYIASRGYEALNNVELFQELERLSNSK